MQQLIDAIRTAGATQPVIAEGLEWGNDLSGWLASRPSDREGQLAAGWHVYNFNSCNNADCWDSTIAPVAQQVPVVATEIGEGDCGGGFLNKLLPWADQHHVGYLAWTWDTWNCSTGPAVISDYNGTPTPFGAAYKAYITASHASQPPPPNIPPSSAPPRPRDRLARFDFENGTTDGWSVLRGSTLALANESGTAWSGGRGLALDVSGTGSPAAGTSAGLRGLAAGAAVTYHVWAPRGVSVGVSPIVADRRSHVTVLANHRLRSGWTTITFTIPPKLLGLRVLGLQVNDGSGWKGRLVLDDVSWKAPRRHR